MKFLRPRSQHHRSPCEQPWPTSSATAVASCSGCSTITEDPSPTAVRADPRAKFSKRRALVALPLRDRLTD